MTIQRPGTRVGPYLLTELVGRGGMGEVYRASRADLEYRQEVAVKLIRAERTTPEVIRRFQVERVVLARLDHPNIATLLDAGLTESGLPYLVMQYVPGLPITQYAEQHRLGVGEKLRLFRRVIDAVQFAHANLVVHRDLKPSNILVTPDGQPRLLDFGIAKLLTGGDPQPLESATTDIQLLTPEYASPEQFLGQPITTATDVYGLGVLLYELLTGARPFQTSSPAELARAILEREPENPSRVRRGPGGPDLDADLDAITLMALRKEPGRRYASAAQMGEDVQRYLDNRPVIARPDSWGYRVGRFVRRNRGGVAAAAIVGAFLGGATLVTGKESHRRVVALKQADTERIRALRLTDFMLQIFQPGDTGKADSLVTARDLLDHAALRLQRDLADQPLQRADLEFAIGKAYTTLGQASTAAATFERVVDARQKELRPDDAEVGEALEWLGRARAYQGKLADAARTGREALAIKEKALGPSDPSLVPTLTLIARIGNILDSRDTSGTNLPLLERALAILRAQPDPNPRELANVLRSLGNRLTNRNEGAQAQAYIREAITVARAEVDSNHPFLFNLYEDLGSAFRGSGLIDSAVAIDRWLLSQRLRVFGPEHPDVAFSYHNIGADLIRSGKSAEAIPMLERAVAIRERVGGPNHYLVGHTLYWLGVALDSTGDMARGERVLTRAVSVLRQSLGPRNSYSITAQLALARCQIRAGKQQAGLAQLEAAVAAGGRVSSRDPGFVSVAKNPRFLALVAGQGQPAE